MNADCGCSLCECLLTPRPNNIMLNHKKQKIQVNAPIKKGGLNGSESTYSENCTGK